MTAAAIHLLFIGNSLTAANDLPALVAALGRASGVAIECTTIAKPDFSLEDHWQDGDARKAIARGGWTFVILQQGPSALPESRVLLEDYVKRFDAEIRRVRARTALYMVWPSAARRGDFDGVSRSYAAAAALVAGTLLAAGDAWRAAWRIDPGLHLYGPDGFHPTPAGSLLAAMVVFDGVTGRPPPSIAVPGVSAHELEILQHTVAHRPASDRIARSENVVQTGAMRTSVASEPRERSAPANRRARARVGESEGRSPSVK